MSLPALLVGVACIGMLAVPSVAQISPHVVETYPVPASRVSALYDLQVYDGEKWVVASAHTFSASPYPGFGTALTGKVTNLGPLNGVASVSWATIGVSHAARVRVRYLGGAPTTTMTVLPSRYGISSTFVAGSPPFVEFTIQSGQKVFIKRIDDPVESMFVFANPNEPPQQKAWLSGVNPPIPFIRGNVWVFPAGEHVGTLSLPATQLPSGVDTVYLAPGSWVTGGIRVDRAPGNPGTPTRIVGPGVLSGEGVGHGVLRALQNNFAAAVRHVMIYSLEWHNGNPTTVDHGVEIDGPTIVAGPFYNMMLNDMRGQKTIRNLHLINPWNYNSDGFHVGGNATVENCFAFNNDDTVFGEEILINYGTSALQYKSLAVRDCVFCGRTPFLIGYGVYEIDQGNSAQVAAAASAYANVERCDVAFMLDDPDPSAAGVFCMRKDGRPGFKTGNQVYRDIRIEGRIRRLINLQNTDVPWGNLNDSRRGRTENILFDKIDVLASQVPVNSPAPIGVYPLSMEKSKSWGYWTASSSNPLVVEFRDVTIAGVKVLNGDNNNGGIHRNWYHYFLSPPAADGGWSSVSWTFK